MPNIIKILLFVFLFIVLILILYIVITTSGYIITSIIYGKQYDINTGCDYKSTNTCENRQKIMCNFSESFHIYRGCFLIGFLLYLSIFISLFLLAMSVGCIYNNPYYLFEI